MNKNVSTKWNRREFLEFLGQTSLVGTAVTAPLLTSCQTLMGTSPRSLKPSTADQVELIEGLQYKVLIEAGASLGKNINFGYNNDYIVFLPKNDKEAYLWVNHESVNTYLVNGRAKDSIPTKAQYNQESQMLGGSFFKIIKKGQDWKYVDNAKENFVVHGQSKIPFAKNRRVRGKRYATGTFANCAGGLTPWGTILTCEENYQFYVGEAVYDENGKRTVDQTWNYRKWHHRWTAPPEHYGWVVEVNPKTKKSKKLTSLGRFSHEGACVVDIRDGRHAVYMGDDDEDQCLYKFISKKPGSLDEGELFVADFILKKWVSLDRRKSLLLQSKFKNQLEIQTRTREAAKMMGGTPLNRPEDIERDPVTGHILMATTNNIPKGDYYGAMIKIIEKDNDPLAENFEFSTFMAGGKDNDFACPDNLVFAPNGDLWFTVDISESKIELGPYKGFGNNSLYHVPRKGPRAGEAIRVANAPVDAEFTGPYFSDDGKTLFVAVQHPGASSSAEKGYTSHWPHGGDNKPNPAIIAITGPYLES